MSSRPDLGHDTKIRQRPRSLAVSRATGMARTTIARGIKELRQPEEMAEERVRRPGCIVQILGLVPGRFDLGPPPFIAARERLFRLPCALAAVHSP